MHGRDALRDFDVATYTAEHGGGTFDALTGRPFEPKHGYAVARVSAFEGDVKAECMEYIGRHIAGEYGTPYFGTWVTPEGRIAIDPVEYVISRERAITLGRHYGQRAIWDFAAGEVIIIEWE